MYQNIDSLVSKLSKITKVSYFTNGLLFDRFSLKEISDMGIQRIKVSLYNDGILKNNSNYLEMYQKIVALKTENPTIKFKAAFMIDTDFFKVIHSSSYQNALKVFDSIKWQPLTVGADHPLYSTTIEGMDKNIRKEIFYVLSTFPDNKVQAYQDVLNQKPIDVCYMGKPYLTMNPDMSISLCPHLNEKTLTIAEYEKIMDKNPLFFVNPTCRTMRCISLQAFLTRKYGEK